MWTEEDAQKMDMAADKARQELEQHKMELQESNNEAALQELEWLRIWWNRNFMKAGHKRLGRALIGR